MRMIGIAAVVAVAVAGCTVSTGSDDAQEPAREAAAPDATQPTGLDLAEARREAVVAEVAADEDCTLMQGVERVSEVIDLGDPNGGVGAVLVTCSAGMPDLWSRLYVVTASNGEAQRVDLVQYDVQGDGQWRAEFATPNLRYDAEMRQFVSSISSGPMPCELATRWRWDPETRRIALVQQTVQDCSNWREGQDLPEARVIWPTTPPTPEPAGV